ncbi:TetR/AcrR family transcriptional regulator [Psychrobacillus psychrodurans]|uniref:TetR/AcrR family transcriptional regulator n=1 Tax=Psychrobacillus psychrodurans TaxID=126157 RepID=A0A9X3LBG7_9BACI|nr:TetR/AcrR family transcriptional regulator [Psychrobacillus psychrodurans]MCZ8534717.1 TetR/AcrR family transcriptional regulator [Psychrobacillus psychrodurans]
MKSKQEQRSEETKKLILDSAANLFAKKGYDAVTIREIAKDAGCSHTAIYLYFKDKETLLHQLSLPPLHELHQKLQDISREDSISSESKLKEISLEYIFFCLKNRNMYDVFLNAKSSRVDEKPELEINRLRIAIFELLKSTIQENLSISNEEQLLAFSRIFYYQLNGVLSTYSYQHEPLDVLMERLIPTFNLSIEVLLIGFQEKLK